MLLWACYGLVVGLLWGVRGCEGLFGVVRGLLGVVSCCYGVVMVLLGVAMGLVLVGGL